TLNNSDLKLYKIQVSYAGVNKPSTGNLTLAAGSTNFSSDISFISDSIRPRSDLKAIMTICSAHSITLASSEMLTAVQRRSQSPALSPDFQTALQAEQTEVKLWSI